MKAIKLVCEKCGNGLEVSIMAERPSSVVEIKVSPCSECCCTAPTQAEGQLAKVKAILDHLMWEVFSEVVVDQDSDGEGELQRRQKAKEQEGRAVVSDDDDDGPPML